MGNGFEALKPLSMVLRERERARHDQEWKQEKTRRRIANETLGVLRAASRQVERPDVRMSVVGEGKDGAIDFTSAMREAGVRPLGSGSRRTHPRQVAPEPVQTRLDNAQVLEESMSDEADGTIEFLESDEGMCYRRQGVGPDVPRDLRRGRWVVMGQLDMHGMFVEEAREALAKFLRISQRNDRLCVRIIHGKGNGSPGGFSVLREKVRRWLKQRDEVIAFVQPYERDGGAGATVVRLRSKPRP